MANGNGNNINTDDAAAAAAAATTTTATTQDQQHLTGDGGGAVKLRGNNINDLVADLWLNGTSGSNSRGDYTNIRATTTTTTTAATATTATATSTTTNAAAAATSSSTFSFKHFLNSSGTITAPSSTVTSLDTACGSNSSSSNNTNALTTSSSASTSSTSTSSLQTSTGARPKVPQSASVSHMQPDLNGSAASKMKRSPRFSSFDSQASLAEYAACGSSTLTSSASSGSRLRPDLRLEVERSAAVVLNDDDDYEHVGLAQVRNSCLYDDHADDDVFPSPAGNLSHASTSSSRYVPRSYSSYDMPPTCPSSSPRRRPALRPNRLVLSSAPKMKLDLPLDTSNVAGAASALPDFVQDHLPDSWCQEAHLSSPPSSPLGAAEAPSCGGAAGGGSALLLPAAACQLPSNSSGSSSGGNNVSLQPTGQAGNEASGSGSTGKMLPDFLSDGPILHSSQRLADVAIGLPSNSIDSPPQEADNSTLHQQNEQLQRELQETRDELSVQTRRAHEFEQQLLALTDARRRETQASSAQTQSTQRLRRQVAQLEAELFAIRGGSDLVSGVSGASVITPGSSHSTSSSSNASRPSRTHHLSRDLLRAADSAEQNLRQMLAGVDNLRQIAANLEQPQAPAAATPRSPSSDPYTDFK